MNPQLDYVDQSTQPSDEFEAWLDEGENDDDDTSN